MNAIILVVDRLHAGYLGCYGNSWVATPQFDRLAAESFVFDQAVIDSPRLPELYASYWLGSHVGQRRSKPPNADLALPRRLEQAGVATTLITDETEVSQHVLADQFGEIIRCDAASDSAEAAGDVAETRLAGAFAVAIDWLAEARGPFCLWLHVQGLGAAWDAPAEFRRQYADAEEPLPPDFVAVPCRRLSEDYDPDELLGICQAYAGQVSLLDLSLGGLLEALRAGPLGEQTLLAVTSARGFPLGEHRGIGAVNDALHGELVQVPWMLRLPDATGAMDRSQALVQPADLPATLLDWWSLGALHKPGAGRSLLPLVRGETAALRDHACMMPAGGERGIRTSGWYLRLPADRDDAAGPARGQLYAKPDDRWEVNDVADRCADTAEALQRALAAFEAAAEAGALDQLAPLDESLVEEFR
ncbi:MAG TPA: sulfatase-like hydrolase/transferase [Pirellulales bacterium]|nr:sulfatase-like hydrolase/transferase [Pirellulales bacterium]